ncbi:peroxiredoxin [Stappia sp. WLB 29]|uniref:peroxiredoxin n=1 Tax=Stappia sp. WLB 29 TaxID=2925220 RepID=UPI0020C098A4|nr:peroxiredoxin [Stappia sp. WLB 29]
MSEISAGSTAPDFELERDGGDTLRLSDLRGRKVVLYFYPKDDTPGCTKEAIAFTALASEFEAAGAVIVGISPDTAAKHDKFKAKHDLSVILAADPDSAVATAWGVWVEKSMYGKKYMGVERSTFLIDEAGKIVETWHKVKVPGHAEAVLESVRAAGG